ncbi:heme-binding protein [Undibacterium sp. Rencai35W]|uniref:heme-binding protein n=1 Tax=Undibacterium sp. Rencai35W TaxID=3413046 RepID=UPI003BF2B0D1
MICKTVSTEVRTLRLLYEEKLSLLKKLASEVGLRLEGEPVLSRYNSPFSLPFFRRNEIWIRVLM